MTAKKPLRQQRCMCCSGTQFVIPENRNHKEIVIFRGKQYECVETLIAAFPNFSVRSRSGLRARWKEGRCFFVPQSEMMREQMCPNGVISLRQPKITSLAGSFLSKRLPMAEKRLIDGREYYRRLSVP